MGADGYCARSSNRSTMRSKASLTSDTPAGAPAGVAVTVLQRILALTAAIWPNEHTSQPVIHSLNVYDH